MKLKITEKIFKQTRVKILCDEEKYFKFAFDEIIRQREILENYVKENPIFLESLEPVAFDRGVPEIVKRMCSASEMFDVGPMAAVAGVIAELSCMKMVEAGAKNAIVENGGDIYAVANNQITIAMFSNTRFDNLAFVLRKDNTPVSICSSSSFLGHSLSLGECDLAVVFSKDAALADCGATKLGNMVKKEEDIKKSLDCIMAVKGVLGAMAIKNEKIGMIGKLPEITFHKDAWLKEKITKDELYLL
ncbi:UPF0280 family protein [Candidatus Woesearchaeota archaeon]|nr:UPF0280 family protein [Candidatus Woesearchaeota archaeon]